MNTTKQLKKFIDENFGGKLCRGEGDGITRACLLTAKNKMIGEDGDNPDRARMFDIRPLNDAFGSDELRTEWMLKIHETYEGSLDWPKERQKKVVEAIVIKTVNSIIAELPGLSNKIRSQCRKAKTLEEAEAAAEAAEAAEAWAEAWAAANAARAEAWAAANAARAAAAWAAADVAREAAADAAWAATTAAREAAETGDKIAAKACQLWIEAAKEG